MKIKQTIRRILGISDLNRIAKENNRMLHELNWANVFKSTIVGSAWLKNQSFSPGRFAAGYPLLYYLYRILNDTKPKSVLEFGLGQSSKLLFQYAQYNPDAKVTSIEHDSAWIHFFTEDPAPPSNAEIIQVENAIIKYKGVDTLSVNNIQEVLGDNKFDLILVDGPNGSERYSRSQILQLIPHNINTNHFCIIMDDFERDGEKETCSEMEDLMAKHNIAWHKEVVKGEKFFALYCSENLKFLKSI